MQPLFRLFAVMPLWLVHAVGALLGWLAFAASPTYRRRFLANAAQAGYRFAQVRAAVAHAGRMVAEAPRLWQGDALPPCEVRGADCVEQAWAAGKGIVFLTPHIGCFELSVQEGARRWAPAHGPFTILYRPARQPWLARVMEGARSRGGIQAVPTTLHGVRQMIKALRAGRAVGLLPDQVPPEGLGQWAPFFGRQAYTMTLAARLAQQTGAAVILARCERLVRGRGYVLHLQALESALGAPLAPTLDAAVLQINQAMEFLIRQSPEQYLWGYARYKRPRPLNPSAPAPAEPSA